MDNKYMKKYSASSAKKKMQIKTILRFHLISVRMAIIKKTNSNKYCQGCGEKVPLYILGGDVN
jgi:hypothetical protein